MSPRFRVNTTLDRYSRFTWWQMPVSGGTTRKSSNACCAQRSNWYRSWLRENSRSALIRNDPGPPKESAMTEWSITSSEGIAD